MGKDEKKEEKKPVKEEVENKKEEPAPQKQPVVQPEYFQFFRNCPHCKTFNEYWIIKPQFVTPFKMNLKCGYKGGKGGCKQVSRHLIDPTKPGKKPKDVIEDKRQLVPAPQQPLAKKQLS